MTLNHQDKLASTVQKLKVALVVNRFSGIGGEAALKGSDGDETRARALDYHKNHLRAPSRVKRFLDGLTAARNILWFSATSDLGERYLCTASLTATLLSVPDDITGSSKGTQAAVEFFIQQGVDLILFAGGDGTARDVLDVLERQNSNIACLGIPCGVKMQSGVFAITPEAAAHIVDQLVVTDLVRIQGQDVRDIDEDALRNNQVRSKYYGSMQVPSEPHFLQHVKQAGVEDEQLVFDDIGEQLREIMHESGKLMIVGPGKTTDHFMQLLGLENTLVGFDAIYNGELVQSDLTAIDLLQLQDEHPDLLLVISPTGNQGVLIGRGNQQLTVEFLSLLNKEQWLIVSTKAKLSMLKNKPFLVDSNDVEFDKELCGLYPVITGYNDKVWYPVNISYQALEA